MLSFCSPPEHKRLLEGSFYSRLVLRFLWLPPSGGGEVPLVYLPPWPRGLCSSVSQVCNNVIESQLWDGCHPQEPVQTAR